MAYKTMKVFDVHYSGMPAHIKTLVKENYEIMCNGCYFQVEVMPKTVFDEMDDGFEKEVECEEYNDLHKWLYDQGAFVGETVLILYWW